jgi:phosphatidylglycerol:prolipoprotein diacylglycerol transferase
MHALIFPEIDPVLLHIYGPVAIRWYAVSYIVSLTLGWWLIVKTLRNKPLWTNPPFKGKPPATVDDIGDFFVWATLGVIVGGRLGWVVIYGTILCSVSPEHAGFCQGLPMEFLTKPWRIFAAWEGGMSFHGGVLGVVVATWLFAKKRGINVWSLGDLVCIAEPIGGFFVRIANFVNGELWGRTTDVPWGIVFCNDTLRRLNHGICPAGDLPRHPSQLYEAALEGIVMFVVLQVCLRVFRLHERPGLICAIFFTLYAVFRFTVEFFREPDTAFVGWLSMGMALSVLMIAAGCSLIWFVLQRPRHA